MRHRLLTIAIFCAYIQFTTAQTTTSCRSNDFHCRNGQCIPIKSLCNGKIDCLDSSDETRNECGRAAVSKCTSRQFRCDYGACVSADVTCDGLKNCADNSDETLPRCRVGNRNDANSETSNCREDQYKCDDGQCINNSEICDGSVDCLDRSDETAKICGSYNCPQKVFRCTYGACIDRQLKCNGEIDCADGSDEDPQLCRFKPGVVTKTSTTTNTRRSTTDKPKTTQSLSNKQWEVQAFQRPIRTTEEPDNATESVTCPPLASASRSAECTSINGKWISCDNTEVPPGTTAKLSCRSSFTPDPADRTSRENVECNIDGIWEPRPINCVTKTNLPSTRRPTNRPTKEPWNTNRLSTPTNGKTYCQLPLQPKNGRWFLSYPHCPESGSLCDPPDDMTEMEQGSVLHYQCNKGYRLNTSDSRIFCISVGTWSVIPVCEAITCPPLASVSRTTECYAPDGDWIFCETTSVPPGTLAKLGCRNNYAMDTLDLSAVENVRCNSKGEWEPKPFKCLPICGVPNFGSATPLIISGQPASVFEFPWHATLYFKDGAKKRFICGASIIKEKMLITAAHCVFNENFKKLGNPEDFYVAVGNMLQEFDHPDHNPQFFKTFKVKKMFIQCKYYGQSGNFAQDIAILVIDKPFVFSGHLMPICLDVTSASETAALETGALGKIAGFGTTETGETSEILMSLSVPFVSQKDCKTKAAEFNDEKYFTADKICAGYTNGSSVCKGDSGGGLVFPTDGKWYLRGIVSVGVGFRDNSTCNAFTYSLYTRVASHMNWIQNTINREESNKPVTPCP